MTADLIRSAIKYAIQRGIADSIINTFGLTGTDEEIDPHVAEWVKDALRQAVELPNFDIRGLLDTVIDTLAGEAMPAGSTEATPEQINHAVAMRKALADMITGSTDRTLVRKLGHRRAGLEVPGLSAVPAADGRVMAPA